ncbi:T9SS type B sorting domain-containing protein [uncultured Polaribacter sp.]|uniref:Ig-like domain-containing protein n=1 Tax=uncultured Polaribacter sp. TaxID=174711 RepID=UPI00261F060C|nr:T9SS type B sorting domain-containing protein [uncultured Polaribacter sp.]
MYNYQLSIYRFLMALFLIMPTFLSAQTDEPPVLTAIGNQAFCPGSSINIVTDFTITDVDDTTIDAFFIQISSGYQVNFDLLSLTGSHPNISKSWNTLEGKLTLSPSPGNSNILLTDLENAVKDVVFTTTSNNINSEKSFSLTVDDALYLPSTDHFYQFISQTGITWKEAKVAAENKTYYGRQGYLATLTSQEEADFAGEQASGAGWIGGSDEETEGVWKWVTGPEAGTVFWNGLGNGSSPTGEYANWHTTGNEPNNLGGNEHYAHITHPNLGVPGKWNDLPNISGVPPGDDYYPQGYIVEYGAPGDPQLNIVASTNIYIPEIQSTTNGTICESGTVTISATANEGTILWFENLSGGTPLTTTGNNFTTPILTANKTYFAAVSVNGCTTSKRTAINITVNQRPTITNISEDLICSGKANLSAIASQGSVNWYASNTSNKPIFTGNNFETPILNTTTSYFVEAVVNNCSSVARTEVKAIVDSTIPEFDLVKSTYYLCEDIGSVTLETENALGNYTYVWKKENTEIAGSTFSKEVLTSGNYTVKAISDAGCESAEKLIEVKNSSIATINIDDVVLIDDSDNNSIQIISDNLGTGDYEFALDDEFGVYKEAKLFEKIETGLHTLFVKDKNGCGTTPYQFSILALPKFFTPNGDGKNDIWKIDGFTSNQFTIAEVSIYNRFGVLLYQLNTTSQGWDGMYQGKLLPSSTYWYRILLNDINGRVIEKKGSIGLIRK